MKKLSLNALLFFIIISASLLACKKPHKENSGDTLPNIVFLFIDDLGISSVPFYQQSPTDSSYTSSYANGDSSLVYQIPNLYNFAQESRVYTNMYSTALCAPSRAALITGRYPFRNGIVYPQWAADSAANYYPNNLDGSAPLTQALGHLNTGQVGYPEVLRAKGYNTVFGGKWNLRFGYQMAQMDGRVQPQTNNKYAYLNDTVPLQAKHLDSMGFNQTFGPIALVGNTIDYYPPQLQDSATIPDKYLPNLLFDYMADTYIAGAATNTAQYIHYCFGLLHDPFSAAYLPHEYGYAPPPAYAPDNIPNQVWMQKIQEVDLLVGQFVAMVDSVDQAQGTETIIIIAGDNGTEPTYYSEFNGNFVEGGKSSNSSQGSRVPFMVRWPGTIATGIDSTLMDLTDILPTLVELVGGEEILDSLVSSRNPNYVASYKGGLHPIQNSNSYVIDGQSFLHEMTGGALGNPVSPRLAVYQQTQAQGFVANHDYILTINTSTPPPKQDGFFKINNVTLVDDPVQLGDFILELGSTVQSNPFQTGTQEYINYDILGDYYYSLFPTAKSDK